jgi:hypothetical protein
MLNLALLLQQLRLLPRRMSKLSWLKPTLNQLQPRLRIQPLRNAAGHLGVRTSQIRKA